MKKYYILYQIREKDSDVFYVGRHTTNDLNTLDNHWSESKEFKKYVISKGYDNFTKEIIGFYSSTEELGEAKNHINKKHIGNPNCWSNKCFVQPDVTWCNSEKNKKQLSKNGKSTKQQHLIEMGKTHKNSLLVINQENITRRIRPEKLFDYLENGYSKDFIWMVKGNNKGVRIHPNNFKEYQEKGFVRGIKILT